MNYIVYKLKDYYTTPLDCSECAKLYKYHVQKITDKKYSGYNRCLCMIISDKLDIFIKYTSKNIYKHDKLVYCINLYIIDYSIYKLIL